MKTSTDMTPPDLSDEQIERHRECLTIYYSSCCDCGSEQAELEALASANALCDQALRVRALEQERDDAKSDALRLHKDKMELWEAINFPGGWKERAEASAKDAARYRWLRDNWNHKPARLHTGGGRLVWDSGREQFDTFDEAVDAAKEQPHG